MGDCQLHADVYAADVLAKAWHHDAGTDALVARAGAEAVERAKRAVSEPLVAALLALVPDDQSLVIARDGRVWGAVGTKAIGSNVPGMELPTFYTLVPVTSEEE